MAMATIDLEGDDPAVPLVSVRLDGLGALVLAEATILTPDAAIEIREGALGPPRPAGKPPIISPDTPDPARAWPGNGTAPSFATGFV